MSAASTVIHASRLMSFRHHETAIICVSLSSRTIIHSAKTTFSMADAVSHPIGPGVSHIQDRALIMSPTPQQQQQQQQREYRLNCQAHSHTQFTIRRKGVSISDPLDSLSRSIVKRQSPEATAYSPPSHDSPI